MAKAKKTIDVRDELPKTTSPLRAIRLKCIDCCGGSMKEVERCDIVKCPLHAFKAGKNPYRKKRELTEEQKARLAEMARNRKKTSAEVPDE